MNDEQIKLLLRRALSLTDPYDYDRVDDLLKQVHNERSAIENRYYPDGTFCPYNPNE